MIIGCHYDAWTFGGVSPNTGTAVMMEIAKSFGAMAKKGIGYLLLVFLCTIISTFLQFCVVDSGVIVSITDLNHLYLTISMIIPSELSY